MQLKYPVFVPTKGRFEKPLTIRALDAIGVDFRAVVEPQEAEQYAPIAGASRLLVLPFSHRGLVATRNWIWDQAEREGAVRFWTFDDNIRTFYRLNHNKKIRVQDAAMLCAIEDFVDRYLNVAIAGCNYQWLAKQKQKIPPLEFNTRVYSNMLIRTDIKDRHGAPFRNQGFYNDDTDLCLRVLKDGWVTLVFNAFLIDKMTTMSISGGMTPHYQGDGRLKMAQELADRHPDVARISWKWGRWQHHVDYRPFRYNRLKLKPQVQIPAGVNDYGMRLRVRDQ
jgi:hypothetical protein